MRSFWQLLLAFCLIGMGAGCTSEGPEASPEEQAPNVPTTPDEIQKEKDLLQPPQQSAGQRGP